MSEKQPAIAGCFSLIVWTVKEPCCKMIRKVVCIVNFTDYGLVAYAEICAAKR